MFRRRRNKRRCTRPHLSERGSGMDVNRLVNMEEIEITHVPSIRHKQQGLFQAEYRLRNHGFG